MSTWDEKQTAPENLPDKLFTEPQIHDQFKPAFPEKLMTS